MPFEAADTDAKELIHFLAQQDLGPYLQFSDEVNYYISEKYDGADYIKEDLTNHIKNGDVDLIFCMDTQPGDLLINEMGVTEVPVMVSGSVDPVGAGLCDTEKYSGKANVWRHMSTDIYRNQMKYYYDSHPFQNIGMVYYDEAVGFLCPYSEAAEEIGFQITAKKISPEVTVDYYENIRRIYEELVADGIDTFLLNADIIKDAAGFLSCPRSDRCVRPFVPEKEGKKKALFMMLGIFCYIVFLFFAYCADYVFICRQKPDIGAGILRLPGCHACAGQLCPGV